MYKRLRALITKSIISRFGSYTKLNKYGNYIREFQQLCHCMEIFPNKSHLIPLKGKDTPFPKSSLVDLGAKLHVDVG